MSSSKYLQKRVGYLGAVQSFRPDTEVLMLATNMLKKVRFDQLMETRASRDDLSLIPIPVVQDLSSITRTSCLPTSPLYHYR